MGNPMPKVDSAFIGTSLAVMMLKVTNSSLSDLMIQHRQNILPEL